MKKDILNETFQKHLKRLQKDLLIEKENVPTATDDLSTDVLSSEVKEEFWNNFQKMSVKAFVDKYKKNFSDPKFHAFISAGLADKINDENFTVTSVSPLVTALTPTQMEIGFGNSLNDLVTTTYNMSDQLNELDHILNGSNVMLKAKTGKVPVVIFNNKYIIDGHHRWSKIYCGNKNATVACLNFDCPSLKDDPSMALKAFHLAIAKMLKDTPTEDKSGANLLKSNSDTVYKHVYQYLILPNNKPFLDVYKEHSELIKPTINPNLNEEEQLNPASVDPFAKTVSLYIAGNAAALISSTLSTPATDTPRSHMPQTDRAPGYEDALKNGEINFLPDKVTEKMVNETFQRHLTLLHKKLLS